MTKRKRAASLLLACLAFLIFCGVPFQQAHAVAVVDDAIVAVIILALAGMGITFSVTGGYLTAREWVREAVESLALDFSFAKYGVDKSGNLLINNTFLDRVRAIATYLVSEFGLIDNNVTNVQSSGTISGSYYAYATPMEFHAVSGSNRFHIVSSGSVSVILCWATSEKTAVRPVVVSQAPFTVSQYVQGSPDGNHLSTATYNSIHISDSDSDYYAWWNNSIRSHLSTSGSTASRYDFSSYVVNNTVVASQSDALSVARSWFGDDPEYRNSVDIVTGTLDIPSSNDIAGNSGVLTLPLPWGVTLPEILGDVPGLVVDEELGGVTLDLESDQDVADSIDQSATSSEVISANPDDYAVTGLSQVFPFCIPFDLYDFLDCLAADPEAPSVTWRFYVPRICDETIEIDLSEFDTAAQVLRTMELLLFCVGLAFVTRHLLRG